MADIDASNDMAEGDIGSTVEISGTSAIGGSPDAGATPDAAAAGPPASPSVGGTPVKSQTQLSQKRVPSTFIVPQLGHLSTF
jgi:hypothetical protein